MLVISVLPRETLFTYVRSRLCDDVEVQPREKKGKGSKEREKKKEKRHDVAPRKVRVSPTIAAKEEAIRVQPMRPSPTHTAFRNFRCAKLAVLETLKNPESSNRLRT